MAETNHWGSKAGFEWGNFSLVRLVSIQFKCLSIWYILTVIPTVEVNFVVAVIYSVLNYFPVPYINDVLELFLLFFTVQTFTPDKQGDIKKQDFWPFFYFNWAFSTLGDKILTLKNKIEDIILNYSPFLDIKYLYIFLIGKNFHHYVFFLDTIHLKKNNFIIYNYAFFSVILLTVKQSE